MANIQCCYQCADRIVGCHSICEKYAKVKAEADIRDKVIRDAKTEQTKIYDAKIAAIKRVKNSRGRKKLK